MSARCTWGRWVKAGRQDRGHLSLGTERQGRALPACRRGCCPGVPAGSSPGPCVGGCGVTHRAPGRAAAWPEGPYPSRASPPPLRVPAAGGRGLGSVVARQRPAAVTTGQPGVEGTAAPHDGDGAEAVLEAGRRRRRLLPPHHHAHAPARGRRLVSLPGEGTFKTRVGARRRGGGPALSPLPIPPLTPQHPPRLQDRSPSPAHGGQAAPLPAGAPRGPAAAAGLGAGAPGAGHGGGREAPVGGTLGVLGGGAEPLVTPLPVALAIEARIRPMGAALGPWGWGAGGSDPGVPLCALLPRERRHHSVCCCNFIKTYINIFPFL